MTKEEALKVLVKMRAWREWGKGEQNEKDMPEMPEPKEVDAAFDVFIETLSQPSLPPNLDEAADEATIKKFPDEIDLDGDMDANIWYKQHVKYWRVGFKDGFKAGSEWMAGQGVSFDTEMSWLDSFGFQIGWPEDTSIFDCFNEGDKVVVQIRKK